MRAKDIMVEGANVVVVHPDDSVYTAIRLMLTKGISGLPVVERGPLDTRKLVGIVTEGDFLRRDETKTLRRRPRWLEFLVGPGKLAEEYAHGNGRKVEEVMTIAPVTVAESTPLEEIVELMERHNVKRLPVVRGDALVGVVTRSNLLHAFIRASHREPSNNPTGDFRLRRLILEAIESKPWSTGGAVDVHVRNGVAKLTGMILDDRERKAIVVAAENVPGVRSVEDHIAFIEPVSGMVFGSPQDERRTKAP